MTQEKSEKHDVYFSNRISNTEANNAPGENRPVMKKYMKIEYILDMLYSFHRHDPESSDAPSADELSWRGGAIP